MFVETVIEELICARDSGLADQISPSPLVRKPSIKRRKQLKLAVDGIPIGEVRPIGEVFPTGEVQAVGEMIAVGEVQPVGEVFPVGEMIPT